VDVEDGSLRVKDLTDRAVTTLQSGGATGATGANGATGATGALGPKGDKGPSGVSGYEVRTFDYVAGKQDTDAEPGMGPDYNGVGGGGIATVACTEGKEALGGGYWFRSDSAMTSGLSVTRSMPGRMDWTTNTPKPNRHDGWIVQVDQPESVAPDLTMYVICANI
jgi:hypothetical protein